MRKGGAKKKKDPDSFLSSSPGANLINIQRRGLKYRLKKASIGKHTVIFESDKHQLEAY